MKASQKSQAPIIGALQLRMSATCTEDALRALGAEVSAFASINPDAFVSAVLGRESEASTALPIGVAIPHARIAELERIVVGLGIAPKGIDWSGQEVHALFLMAVPTSQATAYLMLVQRLAKLLRDKQRLDELKSFKDEEECRAWLAKYMNLALE